MTDPSFRHFHWTSSVLAAIPALFPYLIGIALAFLIRPVEEGKSTTTFAILSVLGVIAAAVRKHYTERYRIENDHLVRRSGFFTTYTKLLPYERVVNINTTQNTFQRYLGLISIQVQAASESAIELPGIKKGVYEELDARIRSFKDRRESDVTGSATESEERSLAKSEATERLHRMSAADCFKLGLVRNIALLAVFTCAMALYRQVADQFSDRIGALVERITGLSMTNLGTYVDVELAYGFFPWIALRLNHDVNWLPPIVFISLLVFLFVTVVVASSFVLIWFLYRGFGVTISSAHLEISTSGFINTSRRVPLKRIQFIETVRSLRHRLLNSESASLYTTSLSYSESYVSRKLSNWLVPIGRPEVSKQITRRVFSHLALDERSWSYAVQSSWRRRLKKHLAIWFPISCILALVSPLFLIVAVFVLPLLVLEAKRFVMGLRYRLTSDAILMERGWWVRRSTVIPLQKVQCVRLTQSVFDARHEVVTLGIATAGGSLLKFTASVPYISYEEARAVSAEIYRFLRQHPFDG